MGGIFLSFNRKNVLLLAGVLVPVSVAIVALILHQLPTRVLLKEDRIETITMVHQDQEITIDDDEQKKELLQVINELELDSPLKSNVMPQGWTFNISFMDDKKELDRLVFVGEHVYYKKNWYQVDERYLLHLQEYFAQIRTVG